LLLCELPDFGVRRRLILGAISKKENERILTRARKRQAFYGKSGCTILKIPASLFQGDVESLPFKSDAFDSIVNTMALSGYPDGIKAVGEMLRVLRNGGKLVMIDVNYPKKRSRLGFWTAKGWAAAGDIIRDMDLIFNIFSLAYTDEEIGGFGSVHLYVAIKQ
jgi:ubiquinone/menaquinone biosynthesis C-methylase UbiE